jgi:hypothetical protein
MAATVPVSVTLLNNDGSPVASAPVHVFDVSTDNLSAIYSDDKGTAAANPISTNGSGVLSFFALPGAYDLGYYDNKNTLHVQDVYAEDPGTDYYGASVSVTTAATTAAITLANQLPDAAYSVSVTPSWGTTAYVTNKTAIGFTINFGTAAPAGATVDWQLNR